MDKLEYMKRYELIVKKAARLSRTVSEEASEVWIEKAIDKLDEEYIKGNK